jgi:hypothetical protein
MFAASQTASELTAKACAQIKGVPAGRSRQIGRLEGKCRMDRVATAVQATVGRSEEEVRARDNGVTVRLSGCLSVCRSFRTRNGPFSLSADARLSKLGCHNY